MRRKKLLFYAKSLNPGGPEIALVSLLGQLSPEEYDVDLILFDNQRIPGVANLAEKIPDWVNVYDYVAESSFNTSAQEFPVLVQAGPYQLMDFTQEGSAVQVSSAPKLGRGISGESAQKDKGIPGPDRIVKGRGRGKKAPEAAQSAKLSQSAQPIKKTRRSRDTSKIQPIQVQAIKTPVTLRTHEDDGQTLEAGSVIFVETQSFSNPSQGSSERGAGKTRKRARNKSENKIKTEKGSKKSPGSVEGTVRNSLKKRKTAQSDTRPRKGKTDAEPKEHLESRLEKSIDSFFKGNLFRSVLQKTPLLRSSELLEKRSYADFPHSAYEYARAIVADQDYDWAFSYGEWVPASFVAQEVQAQSKAVWVHGDEYSREELANLLAYEGYYEKIVFTSHYISEKNAAYIPLLADKAVVVYNFCDNEPLKQLAQEPVEDLRLDERPLIVTIADIRNEKNCMKLLDVAQGLKESGLSFHWVCVTSVPDEMMQPRQAHSRQAYSRQRYPRRAYPRQAYPRLSDKVRKKCTQLNLDGDISWISGAANPYKYLNESHVLASLSDSESWCSAISEAKTLGIPVVATRTGDALEQITDSVDGILTDFSVDEICGALRNVLKDKALQRRIRKNLQESQPEKAAIEQFTHLIKRKRRPLQRQIPQHKISVDLSKNSIPKKEAGKVAEKVADRPESKADKALARMNRVSAPTESKLPQTSTPAKTTSKKEGRAKSGKVRHMDNRTLIVLDDVNYCGGSHHAVRNLLQELDKLDISVFTAVMPTMATLKKWGHVKFVFPPDELWEAHLLPELLCKDEPRMGLGYALGKALSKTQTWLSKGRMIKAYWKRLGHKGQKSSAEYELRRRFSQYDTVCVIGEDSAYREIVANCSCRTKIVWIYTDYAAWKNSGLGARIASRRDAYIYALFNYIVFTSQASREGFIGLYPQLAAKTRVIGNALPVEAIRIAAQKTRRKLKIVTIARLDTPKGMDRMLKIAAQLIYQGYDFTWNVVGSGPKEASLKKKVKAMNIQGYVNFLGEMANPYCVLGQADLFALFSEYEGLSNAIFEALILGIPVIATRVGGITEQVVEGKNGWLVGNNEEEILKGLRYIMDNPEELDLLTNKMPVYHYNNDDVIEQVRDLFL